MREGGGRGGGRNDRLDRNKLYVIFCIVRILKFSPGI